MLTVATDSSLEVHVTILFVAFVGLNVGLRTNVLPNSTVLVLSIDILSNDISGTKLSTNITPYSGFRFFPEKYTHI